MTHIETTEAVERKVQALKEMFPHLPEAVIDWVHQDFTDIATTIRKETLEAERQKHQKSMRWVFTELRTLQKNTPHGFGNSVRELASKVQDHLQALKK